MTKGRLYYSVEYNIEALKTLGGAIQYTLTRYDNQPRQAGTGEILASHLHVPANAHVCVS